MKLAITSFVVFSAFLFFFQFALQNEPTEISANESSNADTHMLDQFLQNIPSLPRYMEAGYSPLGRAPVVDALLADPLYLPKYAEIVAELIKNNPTETPLFSLQTSLLTAAGMPLTALDKNDILKSPGKVPDKFLELFSPPIAAKIYGYWMAFRHIQQEVDNLFKGLSIEEKSWIKENYQRYFFTSQESDADYDFFTTDSTCPLQFFDLASRIDLAQLADCSIKLSLIADDFYQSREEFSQVLLEENFIFVENDLKLIISAKSHTTHHENADFFIDLGGHNTIQTNAGGTEGSRSLALHLDLIGHNTYEGKNFVQGSGFLGVGLLMSCAGNNIYNADSYSQGCGFFGMGTLVNAEGHNHFSMNFGGQAFGLFGSALLWNKKGANTFLARQGMVQAATSTLGIAFLVDNEGENSYTAGVSGKGGTRFGGIGQGGSSGVRLYPWLNNPSFYGGLSYLYIGGGDNKLKTAWLGQGSAYFLGVGIVFAEGANDIFEADYDSQGQGLHLAAGLLYKKGSHGQFKGGWGSLGVSGDRSIGMFIGEGGNNNFEGTDQSLGSSRKPKSVGIFMNIGGQNTYKFQKISNANLQYPQSPNEWSSALFVEVGSDSSYPQNADDFKRGNNSEWGIKDHSVGISTQSEHLKETLLTKFHASPQIPFPFDPIHGWSNNNAYKPLVYQSEDAQTLANEIGIAGYDRRRQIYETLVLMRFKNRHIKYELSALLQHPSQIGEDAFTYAVLWALRNKDKVDLTAIKTALKSENFHSQYARKMAVSLVGTFWTPEATPLLKQIMLHDTSEEIRYYAALALALRDNNALAILEEGAKSHSEIVRYAIARGLQESPNPLALQVVVPLFNDKSFYVRRAAGLTALSLGDKNGVSVVLDTLQHETLDTGDNYGDNIYKQLSEYLGVDFGLNKQAWIKWWNEVKEDFILPSQNFPLKD